LHSDLLTRHLTVTVLKNFNYYSGHTKPLYEGDYDDDFMSSLDKQVTHRWFTGQTAADWVFYGAYYTVIIAMIYIHI